MSWYQRISRAFSEAPEVPLYSTSRFVLISDCHRGTGDHNDNFLKNQNLYFAALNYYYEREFSYIELGDGDELWENRQLKTIVEVHSDIFWILSEFNKSGRLHLLYGNHDIVKRRKGYMERHCGTYYCESSRCEKVLLTETASEGLILENICKKEELFLVHGHQGDLLNDTLWPVARFLVRYIWRHLELVGFLDPTGAGRPRKAKERVEKKLSSYAQEHYPILIAGHTHRPVFSQPKEGNYFNTGSCVHPRCITGIEIENNHITLIKWSVRSGRDRYLSVEREILEGPVPISDYFKK